RGTPRAADDPHLLGTGPPAGVRRSQALEVGAHAWLPRPLLHQVPPLLDHPRRAARRPLHLAHRTGPRPRRPARDRPGLHPRRRPLGLPRLRLQPWRGPPRRPRPAPQGTGTAIHGRRGLLMGSPPPAVLHPASPALELLTVPQVMARLQLGRSAVYD